MCILLVGSAVLVKISNSSEMKKVNLVETSFVLSSCGICFLTPPSLPAPIEYDHLSSDKFAHFYDKEFMIYNGLSHLLLD